MADLAALQKETGNLVGEPRTPPTDGTHFFNADFATYLNEACDEMTRLAGLYRTDVPLDLAAGTALYRVLDPEGNVPLGQVLRVEDADGLPLEETSKDELDNLRPGWRQESGPPTHWYPATGDYGAIGLFPSPDAAEQLTVFIPTKATAMADATDTPWVEKGVPTLQQYHYALPFYAAYKCLIRRGPRQDTEAAKERKAMFDAIVTQAQADPLGAAVAA